MAFFKKKSSGSSTATVSSLVRKKVALVGNPNVGKSVLFNALTGAYVTVSNYPGTSVEVAILANSSVLVRGFLGAGAALARGHPRLGAH